MKTEEERKMLTRAPLLALMQIMQSSAESIALDKKTLKLVDDFLKDWQNHMMYKQAYPHYVKLARNYKTIYQEILEEAASDPNGAAIYLLGQLNDVKAAMIYNVSDDFIKSLLELSRYVNTFMPRGLFGISKKQADQHSMNFVEVANMLGVKRLY